MRRLTILMFEIEQPEGLTSRKLVAETMKHNVLTAYSVEEGMHLLRHDEVHLVLVHSLLAGGAEEAMRQIREVSRDVPILQILPKFEEESRNVQVSRLASESMRSDELDKFCNYLDSLSQSVLGVIPARHSETRLVNAPQHGEKGARGAA